MIGSCTKYQRTPLLTQLRVLQKSLQVFLYVYRRIFKRIAQYQYPSGVNDVDARGRGSSCRVPRQPHKFWILLTKFCAGGTRHYQCPAKTRCVLGQQDLQGAHVGQRAIAGTLTPFVGYREQPPGTLYAAPGGACLLYTSPSPRDATLSRMPSSA